MADKANEYIERLNELERTKNPPSDSMLKYFEYGHLPQALQEVSYKFYELALWLLANTEPTDPRERQVALRKLLEASDAAVRSVITRD